MTKNKAKGQKTTRDTADKSLGDVLDILYCARIEAALDKIAAIREQIAVLFARAQQGHLSSSDAKTLSLHLQRELSRTVCNLESWHLQCGNRI